MGGKILAGVLTLYGIDQGNPLSGYGTDFDSGSNPSSITLSPQAGDIAVDILSTYDCGSSAMTPDPAQTERWSQVMTNPNWVRRAATSTIIASGSSVTMSRAAAGGCDWGYVAAVFRAAANPTPTPTASPTATPTITPTVPPAPSGQIWTSYYFAGAQRVAMRVVGDPVPGNNGVFYLLGDHLGGTNIIATASGAKLGELRYRAWGETRYTTGTTNTDYRYTSQREEAGLGLYYYRARWYDPALGRFVQGDQMIPDHHTLQALDRYAYALNRPLLFVDPTGMTAVCGIDCDEVKWSLGRIDWRKYLLRMYGVDLIDKERSWRRREILAVVVAVGEVGRSLMQEAGGTGSWSSNFRGVYRTWGMALEMWAVKSYVYQEKVYTAGALTEAGHRILVASLYSDYKQSIYNVAHELGHSFNVQYDRVPENAVPSLFSNNKAAILSWQGNDDTHGSETFADMYVAWTFGTWGPAATDVLTPGLASAQTWMTANMSAWIAERNPYALP